MRTSVDVHNHLVGRDIRHEMLPVRGRLRSAERIAAVLDLPPQVVGKVVVFDTDRGPVAAIVSSECEPDPERVRASVRAHEVRAVSPARASQLTEYLAEAIPPAGLPAGFRVVADKALADQQVLYFAGGEATAILKFRGADLVPATGARVARIARSPSPRGKGPSHRGAPSQAPHHRSGGGGSGS
ncbi:MAG: aminoacyl-tRNA deacylase [Actinomycetota bacterium]